MHHHAHLPADGDLLLLFAASLFGSAHCIGMCGPYVSACTAQFVPRSASAAQRTMLRLVFNLGRIATYAVIGLMVGAFGQILLAIAARAGLNGIVAVVAGSAAVLFGLSIVGWVSDPARLMVRMGLDRLLRAAQARLRRTPVAVAPLLLGMLQGLLPCALVYAAASRAAVSGGAIRGGLTMVIFGLGTLPAIFVLTLLPQSVLRRFKAQRLAGGLLVLAGLLLLLRGFAAFGWIPTTVLW